eukprot:12457702-Ditylum_brightwellii.AAC.1
MKLFLASMLIVSAFGHNSIRGHRLLSPPSEDCTLNGVALLKIPGKNLDEDFVYDCIDNKGRTARPGLDKKQQENDLDAQ